MVILYSPGTSAFSIFAKLNQGASGSASSSQKSDCEGSTSEDLERSLDDESFKGKFTNALQHSLFIYKNNNLNTENPPQNISCFENDGRKNF